MINHLGQATEAVGLLTHQHGGDFAFNYRNKILCQKQRVAAACARVLNGSAVAVSNLPIFQDQHNGNCFSCLADRGESICYRLAHISGAVCNRSLFNGALVVEEKSGSAFRANDFGNFHNMTLLLLLASWSADQSALADGINVINSHLEGSLAVFKFGPLVDFVVVKVDQVFGEGQVAHGQDTNRTVIIPHWQHLARIVSGRCKGNI